MQRNLTPLSAFVCPGQVQSAGSPLHARRFVPRVTEDDDLGVTAEIVGTIGTKKKRTGRRILVSHARSSSSQTTGDIKAFHDRARSLPPDSSVRASDVGCARRVIVPPTYSTTSAAHQSEAQNIGSSVSVSKSASILQLTRKSGGCSTSANELSDAPTPPPARTSRVYTVSVETKNAQNSMATTHAVRVLPPAQEPQSMTLNISENLVPQPALAHEPETHANVPALASDSACEERVGPSLSRRTSSRRSSKKPLAGITEEEGSGFSEFFNRPLDDSSWSPDIVETEMTTTLLRAQVYDSHPHEATRGLPVAPDITSQRAPQVDIMGKSGFATNNGQEEDEGTDDRMSISASMVTPSQVQRQQARAESMKVKNPSSPLLDPKFLTDERLGLQTQMSPLEKLQRASIGMPTAFTIAQSKRKDQEAPLTVNWQGSREITLW